MSIDKVARKYTFKEQPNDFAFWQSKSFEERLATLEQIRKEYNSWRYDAEQDFKEFIELFNDHILVPVGFFCRITFLIKMAHGGVMGG
jgi:hypothetical protein